MNKEIRNLKRSGICINAPNRNSVTKLLIRMNEECTNGHNRRWLTVEENISEHKDRTMKTIQTGAWGEGRELKKLVEPQQL